ncbi:MAG: alkaline phosphatase PhoX [Saprospiraceae bacterium]
MLNSTLFKHLITIAICAFSIHQLSAQSTFTKRIEANSDDLEEYIGTVALTNGAVLGNMDDGSSDLELGQERPTSNAQIVGLRFNGIAIPRGAIITSAYLQFTVDDAAKNTDPVNLKIFGESVDSAATFDPTKPFNISARPKTLTSIDWKIDDATWKTIGEAGKDQKSSNIAALITEIISRTGWKSGNSLALFVTGSGLREAESFDGSPTQAPQLIINFIVPSTLSKRVSSASDDLEEYIGTVALTNGAVLGNLDDGSSDLELGQERPTSNAQLVGMRFNNIEIPKGAVITDAYLQFTVDDAAKNTDPVELQVFGEAVDSAATFDATKPFNLSSRPKTAIKVDWKINDATWKTIGEAGNDQKSTNIGSIITEIVNRSGWKKGNSLALYVTGKGLREAESYDGSPSQAPQLIVNYIVPTLLNTRVSSASDDLEEYIGTVALTNGAVLGNLDDGSSDLELGQERPASNAQLVGMRFNNIQIDANTPVHKAYVQFTVDDNAKNTDPINLEIFGEAVDSAVTFDATKPFNLSSRPKTTTKVAWKIQDNTWKTVGEAGNDQRSTDISAVIKEIVNRPGWKKGNSLAIYVTGSGLREAESYDGSPAQAPQLSIEYLGGGTKSINPVIPFPIKRGASWAYQDGNAAIPKDWELSTNNIDSSWKFSTSIFGFGEKGLSTTIDFGTSTNRPISSIFKKRFVVADVSKLKNKLELNLLCDDGCVVYLNDKEILRQNMPAGNITPTTLASSNIEGVVENVYYLSEIDRNLLKNGENVLAVSVHQGQINSDDVRFDLELKEAEFATNPIELGCEQLRNNFACFKSILPTDQAQILELPSTHNFQLISKTGQKFTNGIDSMRSNADFTGFIPENGSSSIKGHLGVNHERETDGGLSFFDLHFNTKNERWIIDTSQVAKIDATAIVSSNYNCSGGVSPWGTILSCEEDVSTVDKNKDGYNDIGWVVEFDPKSNSVRNYDGKQQKLWAMGCISHENVAVLADQKTVYQGEDDPKGAVYKFIADKEGDLTSGKLYALKLDGIYALGEPSTTTGSWILIPNTTVTERNNTKTLAESLGATLFAGIEDIEVSPLTNELFFTVKGVGRVYKFKDEGNKISGFKTFIGARSYRINNGKDIVAEDWGSGNDNLVFDDKGNLFVLQDGGRNHIWLVRNDHTQLDPKVEVFAKLPFGSEPTGATFTPDYKFMFVSVQEAASSNTTTQKDVDGKSTIWNRSHTIVIGRNESFDGLVDTKELLLVENWVNVYPNPNNGEFRAVFNLENSSNVSYQVVDVMGRVVINADKAFYPAGNALVEVNIGNTGVYFLVVNINGQIVTKRIVVE